MPAEGLYSLILVTSRVLYMKAATVVRFLSLQTCMDRIWLPWFAPQKALLSPIHIAVAGSLPCGIFVCGHPRYHVFGSFLCKMSKLYSCYEKLRQTSEICCFQELTFLRKVCTCPVSSPCLFHTNGSDGVLLPDLPEFPVLFQGGCCEEPSPLRHRNADTWKEGYLRGSTSLCNTYATKEPLQKQRKKDKGYSSVTPDGH